MKAFPFDTHRAVGNLADAGVLAPQAEAIVDAILTAITGGIATKADLAALETRPTWRIALASGIIIAATAMLIKS